MPRKKQPLVNEKPNNKEPDLGILTSKRIEELFGLATEADEEAQPQPSMPTKSKRQIKKDKRDKASASMLAYWAKRKAMKEAVAQNPPARAEKTNIEAEPAGWRYPVITPLLAILRGKKKVEVTTEPEKEVPGNGHKADGATVALIGTQAIVPFKYEGWQPQEIPAAYRHMTPHWLWRRIHWEEQAKIARVKPSGLSPGLKIGAAIVVIVLGILVIFLFGIVLMDQGGG